jgi:hypothetical protein
MPANFNAVILEFCRVCHWAYEAWRTNRVLFDESPRADKLYHSASGPALERICNITQEYFLLQIAKLHDPASQKIGKVIHYNLGIDYIIKFGGWDLVTEAKLQSLQKQLDALHQKILPARNKILSHNDLPTILAHAVEGKFPSEADTAYFKTLEEFVNLVCEKSTGENFNFISAVDMEIDSLASALVK